MRAFVRGKHAIVTSDNKRTMPWRTAVAAVAASKGWGSELLNNAVLVQLVFVFQRPATHYAKNGTLKVSAPAWPETLYDVDKLSRAVLDGLTGVVLRNDARVCGMPVMKVWGSPEGCIVRVLDLDEKTGGFDLIGFPTDCADLSEYAEAVRVWTPTKSLEVA